MIGRSAGLRDKSGAPLSGPIVVTALIRPNGRHIDIFNWSPKSASAGQPSEFCGPKSGQAEVRELSAASAWSRLEPKLEVIGLSAV